MSFFFTSVFTECTSKFLTLIVRNKKVYIFSNITISVRKDCFFINTGIQKGTYMYLPFINNNISLPKIIHIRLSVGRLKWLGDCSPDASWLWSHAFLSSFNIYNLAIGTSPLTRQYKCHYNHDYNACSLNAIFLIHGVGVPLSGWYIYRVSDTRRPK